MDHDMGRSQRCTEDLYNLSVTRCPGNPPRSHLRARVDIEDQGLEEPDKLDHGIGGLTIRSALYNMTIKYTHHALVDRMSLRPHHQYWPARDDPALTP